MTSCSRSFVYRPVGAVHLCGAWFQAADAAPDDGLAAVIVPVDAPVKLSAIAAKNHLGKTVIAGEAAFLAGRADVNCPPAYKLGLHLHKEAFWDDGLMVAFDVVLRHGTVILDTLFRQEIRGVSLLKQGVAHVLLISENFVDGAGVPFCLASTSENAISHKPVGNLIHAGAFEIFSVDALYDLCLLWIDDQVSVVILGVSEEAIVIDLYLTLLVAVLKSQLDVLTHGLAFLLSKARHDCDQHLALRIHRVDGFLFKIDRYVLFFQLPDVLETVECVSGQIG